ncbi:MULTISPECIES: DUF262 domain-containing protein [unclassified Sinorhizobium]|uniref:DUF262 domain-containing protein n=1 Tax=unclassified Sinorhizobium TaxID=2613772 RepID=UPI00352326EC
MAPEDDDIFDAVGEIDENDLSIGSRDFQELVVAPTDWTISVLVDLLKRKKIDLQPNYQRRVAWTPDKMSKFIESLFLRLPVPQVVLAETSPGNFAVIDGKQRLNSIARFCVDRDEPLRLAHCDYRHDLNGMTYHDMLKRPEYEPAVDAFQSHTVRTIVIKNWGSNELIYLLFLRLNQNSVPLSPQELRRALFPGDFMNWLDEKTATSPGMKFLFSKVPDFRMRDMEVAIRYLAFGLFGEQYRGNLKLFLDKVTREFTTNWKSVSSDLDAIWERYERSIKTTALIFGDDAFKVWQNDRYQNTKNRTVMDIMTYYFSDMNVAHAAVEKAEDVSNSFIEVCEDFPDFLRALQTSTKTEQATNLRFHVWGDCLRRVLNIDVPRFPTSIIQFA